MASFVGFSLLGRGPIDILLGITACVPSDDFLVVAATCRPFAFACASDLLGRSCGMVELALDEASLHLEALARKDQVLINVLLIVPRLRCDVSCGCFIALAKLVRLSHKDGRRAGVSAAPLCAWVWQVSAKAWRRICQNIQSVDSSLIGCFGRLSTRWPQSTRWSQSVSHVGPMSG